MTPRPPSATWPMVLCRGKSSSRCDEAGASAEVCRRDRSSARGRDAGVQRGPADEREEPMAWSLEGTYFENCSCDTICPCTWSGLTAHATNDRCYAMLAFHIDRGDIEGVDVGGLTFAMVIDSPPVMSDGNWKVGVVVDAAASADQAGALGQVLGGELGGPPAMLAGLLGEMAGIEQAPAEWSQKDGSFAVRFGDLIDVEVANQ